MGSYTWQRTKFYAPCMHRSRGHDVLMLFGLRRGSYIHQDFLPSTCCLLRQLSMILDSRNWPYLDDMKGQSVEEFVRNHDTEVIAPADQSFQTCESCMPQRVRGNVVERCPPPHGNICCSIHTLRQRAPLQLRKHRARLDEVHGGKLSLYTRNRLERLHQVSLCA